MCVLRRRFISDRNIVIMFFNKRKFYLQDIVIDPDTTNQYIQRILRYARDISTFIVDRSNWYGVITTIWGSIDRKIRFILKVLKNHKNLTDFIKRVEQTKYFIASFVRNPTSNRTLYILYGYESYLSRPIYTERSYNSQPFQRHDNKAHDVRFSSCIYKKNVDSKSKGIDWTN